MPDWILVPFLLAAATVPAAVASRPRELVAALEVLTLLSAVGGALRRADRQADALDEPRR